MTGVRKRQKESDAAQASFQRRALTQLNSHTGAVGRGRQVQPQPLVGPLELTRQHRKSRPPALLSHLSGAPAPLAPVLCSPPLGAQPERRTAWRWGCACNEPHTPHVVLPDRSAASSPASQMRRLQFSYAARALYRRRQQPDGFRDSEGPYRQRDGARLTDRSTARH
ncbi:hypothetical protein NDU88_006488 [Pleurodeles waltl]|uniref:Uncharacterized protein n=1 Tax=Pleurodeles waltl TaxID=8319 RepID=A0AAV7WEY5_PLEWA|nr:hypothetical protein NDU88_006488 [Pleurodeles waltl]